MSLRFWRGRYKSDIKKSPMPEASRLEKVVLNPYPLLHFVCTDYGLRDK